jgi:hypothetical protein
MSMFIKDPEETLDYVVDWSGSKPGPWLTGDDTIATSTWPSPPSGITVASTSNTDTTATIWLSGGTTGQTYSFTNRIVTSAGRTAERTFRVTIRER